MHNNNAVFKKLKHILLNLLGIKLINSGKIVFFIFFVFNYFSTDAQYELFSNDSLINLLKQPSSNISKQKIDIVFETLYRYVPGQPVFDSLKDMMITEVETSRNRELMCDVYERLAKYYLELNLNNENYVKAKTYIDKCFSIANESSLDKYKTGAFIEYALYYEIGENKQKALDYNNQAIALATSTGDDSLISESYSAIALTWNFFSNTLSRFQALLTASDFADKSGSEKLITENEIDIGTFYKENSDYEKSKDYYIRAIDNARENKQWHSLIDAMRNMGQVYITAGEKNIGLAWYNKALALRDSLNLPRAKVNIYLDLLNYYFNYETAKVGLAYLNSHPELNSFISSIGIAYQLNKLYAAAKDQEKQYDSALYFMQLASPFEYGHPANFNEKYNFTFEWYNILKDKGDVAEANKKLMVAKTFADSSGDLAMLKDISIQLDSAYMKTGDFKNAFYYYSRYNFYKDTLEVLGKQKDLLNIEIASTNKKALEQKYIEEEKIRRRDDLEYMGITAAIATIFIVLILFGVFKMSPAAIKGLSFFAFIFLFEFITLLFDEQIQAITHGEPWKVLAIKIVLIAMLLPVHHWLEEKALHFLTFKAHKLRENFRFGHKNNVDTLKDINT